MNAIDYEQRSKIYAEAADTFGNNMQIVVALEELSEVQKELCKALRGKVNTFNLAEEVADATIMLEQIRQMFNINEQVCGYMDEKVLRLQHRIEAFKRGERKIAE
jgi:heme oxygenase